MGTVTIATVSFQRTPDLETNVKQHLHTIDEAVERGADLVVFPEVSLHGYPARSLTRFDPESLLAAYTTAEAVPEGAGVRALLEKAAVNGVHVGFGVIELGDRSGVIYNTAVLCGPDGFIGKYRKVHLGIT
jgi:predicted amidohydrolase